MTAEIIPFETDRPFDTTHVRETEAGPDTVRAIHMAPQAGILPRRYVIHKHSQWCRNCNATHEWSAVYAFNEMMTRTGSGKPVLNLVPIYKFDYNLPFEVVTVERRETPACHECPDRLNLSHLPDPRGTPAWNRGAYVAAPEEAKRNSGGAKKPKVEKTIDDLLF